MLLSGTGAALWNLADDGHCQDGGTEYVTTRCGTVFEINLEFPRRRHASTALVGGETPAGC